jgi:arylsulfatase A-like enzyme
VTLAPYSVWGWSVATHGTPHDYDSHVPLIFYGPPFRPGRYDGFVRTIDLAPTLAAALGVRPTERLDGVVLTRALK